MKTITLDRFTAKELRVLLPFTGGGLLIMLVLLALNPQGRFGIRGDLYTVYGITCATIVAMSFGHDFMHRTLGSMLALPVPRTRIWNKRLGLAFLAILPLTVVFAGLCFRGFYNNAGGPLIHIFTILVAAPLLNALLLAPWLTLVSRSALFGAIVTLTLPLLVVGALSWVEELQMVWRFLVVGAIWTFAIVAGRRKFLTLEAIDGQTAEHIGITVPRFGSATQSKRTPAARQLLKKELMLHELPIVISVVSAFMAMLMPLDFRELWTIISPWFVSALFGSVCIASERQLGLVQTQLLLPVSFRKQWTIKFLTMVTLVALLGFTLPVLLNASALTAAQRGAFFPLLFGCLAAASCSLYTSSLCASPLMALITSMPVSAVVLSIVGRIYSNPGIEHAELSVSLPVHAIVLGFFAFGPIRYSAHNFRRQSEPNEIFRQLGLLLAGAAALWIVMLLSERP